MSFDVTHRLEGARGRAGVIHTPHGDIETPAFVVVGTKATVKSVLPETVAESGATGCEMITDVVAVHPFASVAVME